MGHVPAHVIDYNCNAEAMVGREEDVFEEGGFAASLVRSPYISFL